MSDEKQLAGTVATEQPTMQLRWLNKKPVVEGDYTTWEPLRLQQEWLITEYGGGQRTEWRDVPTVTP